MRMIKGGYVRKQILQNHSGLKESVIDVLETDNDEEDTDDEIELKVPCDFEADDDEMEDQ